MRCCLDVHSSLAGWALRLSSVTIVCRNATALGTPAHVLSLLQPFDSCQSVTDSLDGLGSERV